MHSPHGRMWKNPIPQKPFFKRKNHSNKHFDIIKANVFPIAKDLIPQINKIIFGYLWKGSPAEPIARETLFLPRDRQVIRILVPLIEGQELRIKYLIQLGRKDNNNMWMYLGRYWVSSKRHNFVAHGQFLRWSVIPKNCNSYVPDCYSDVNFNKRKH